MTTAAPHKNRHERARDLLRYLRSDGYTIGGVDEHGRLALEASDDATWPPSRAIRMAISDLEPEMRDVIQRDVAGLLFRHRFKAWQPEWAADDAVLVNVKEHWPKHAPVAVAIHAPELLQVAFVAAWELLEATGDVGPVEAAAALIQTGVEWGPDAITELADFLRERWRHQWHAGAAVGGAFDVLSRRLAVTRLQAMSAHGPPQPELEPVGQG